MNRQRIDVMKAITIHYVFYPFSGGAEAHTHGLVKFGHREIQICHVDQGTAGEILNGIANRILNEGERLKDGQIIPNPMDESRSFRVQITVVYGQPMFRLEWN
ncbi:MAG: DUF4261 domain-containing protein [bacterium]